MTDATRILSAIERGDPHAAEQLLPLVYDELRRLAAQRLAQERPGQTLQATALVHEAYLRLVDKDQARHWTGRGHFLAAAAEALGKNRQTPGGNLPRISHWIWGRRRPASAPGRLATPMPLLDEEAVFHLARQIASPEAREDYLQQACGADAALRARVRALL